MNEECFRSVYEHCYAHIEYMKKRKRELINGYLEHNRKFKDGQRVRGSRDESWKKLENL